MRTLKLLAIVAGAALHAPLGAQQDAPARPDLSGIYEAAPFIGTPDVSQPDPYPYTAAGERAFEAYDVLSMDPRSLDDCAPDTVPGVLWSANPMQISEEDGMIVLRFERANITRSIPLGGALPADTEPTGLGHSVARWEGEVLTIETTHMSGGYLFNNRGYPLSTKGRITERYRREPGENHMKLEVVVDDPANYTETFTLGRNWMWAPHEEIRPWVCIDLGPSDAEPDIDELTRLLEQL